MALITCPECGQSVSDKASVCIHCGFPLAEELNKGFLFCPYCGAKNENTVRVCKQCGKDIVFEEGEKKEVPNSLTSSSSTDIMDFTRTPTDSLSLQQAQYVQQQKMLDLQRQQMNSQARCPKCGSTSLSADKKGYGYGKAAVGALLVGPVGLLAGGIGANAHVCVCLNCGFKFKL